VRHNTCFFVDVRVQTAIFTNAKYIIKMLVELTYRNKVDYIMFYCRTEGALRLLGSRGRWNASKRAFRAIITIILKTVSEPSKHGHLRVDAR